MDKGRAHGKRNHDINAASEGGVLVQSGRRKVEVKMIGLVLLTVLGAAGSVHDFNEAQICARSNPIQIM